MMGKRARERWCTGTLSIDLGRKFSSNRFRPSRPSSGRGKRTSCALSRAANPKHITASSQRKEISHRGAEAQSSRRKEQGRTEGNEVEAIINHEIVIASSLLICAFAPLGEDCARSASVCYDSL